MLSGTCCSHSAWSRRPPVLRDRPASRPGDGAGYARVTAPNWFGVHNHIGTFHAIAACNLAEAAMGVLMEATTPPTSHRWIPKAMQTAYLTKATTRLTAEARLADDVDFDAITTGTDVTVSVSIVDTKGVEVVHCDITTWVTPK